MLASSFVTYTEKNIRDLIMNITLQRQPATRTIYAIRQVAVCGLLTADWEVTISFHIPGMMYLSDNQIFATAFHPQTKGDLELTANAVVHPCNAGDLVRENRQTPRDPLEGIVGWPCSGPGMLSLGVSRRAMTEHSFSVSLPTYEKTLPRTSPFSMKEEVGGMASSLELSE